MCVCVSQFITIDFHISERAIQVNFEDTMNKIQCCGCYNIAAAATAAARPNLFSPSPESVIYCIIGWYMFPVLRTVDQLSVQQIGRD